MKHDESHVVPFAERGQDDVARDAGIDSLSVDPDRFLAAKRAVAEAERAAGKT